MLSMLAIVALAIDVITLYSARSETQRAADSAALVAAKMLVDAGCYGDPGNAALQTTAQTIATTAAKDVARQSVIAGRPIRQRDVCATFPNSGAPSFAINPQVNVTVQNANLPTFFSRIWSRAALTVRASASAEGFNPSNSSSVGSGQSVPVIVRGGKPFRICRIAILLLECHPIPVLLRPRRRTRPSTFFNVTTGTTDAARASTGWCDWASIHPTVQLRCSVRRFAHPRYHHKPDSTTRPRSRAPHRVLGNAVAALISSRTLSALTPRR